MASKDEILQARYRIFDTMLGWFPPGRLVDLSAEHGLFSRRAADAGWQVTAVDAGTVRFPEDPRITWKQQDVRDVSLDGYDLIVNLGLLYHLTLDDQLFLLDRAAGRPMILDTHVATNKPSPYQLSEMVREKDYRGQFYSEAGKQNRATAPWGNLSSFWPTPASLRTMLDERGWDVYTLTPYYLPTRTFFLCQPRDAPPAAPIHHRLAVTGRRRPVVTTLRRAAGRVRRRLLRRLPR